MTTLTATTLTATSSDATGPNATGPNATGPKTTVLDPAQCRRACLARDARFDGLFFSAVATTGIFCRSICPAPTPRADHVRYFPTALAATTAGFRPCLRCRPEAAPASPAWRGTGTTLARAVRLIDDGEWRDQRLAEFAARLGVGDRHLRQLFRRHLGVSPLAYARFRRALFAKRLLQETTLPVAEIAVMAGFASARRCQAACVDTLGLNPRAIRRARASPGPETTLTLWLSYRPPYHWPALRDFFAARQIPGLESVAADQYGRSFCTGGGSGAFIATHVPERCGFRVRLWLDRPEQTLVVVARIRRLLDLDADAGAIAAALREQPEFRATHIDGLRLPGLWTAFEAGVRAILGQQIAVAAARRLVAQLVAHLGEPWRAPAHASPPDTGAGGIVRLFPTAQVVRDADLGFLRIPGRRRDSLRALAARVAAGEGDAPADWLNLPGIGPWTRDYAAFRLGDPDVFLAGDLGVKRALARCRGTATHADDAGGALPAAAARFRPWGSYATLQLWWQSTPAAPPPAAHDSGGAAAGAIPAALDRRHSTRAIRSLCRSKP